MSKPLVVSFSHELGKAEVIRRITDGIEQLKTKYPHLITILENDWKGDHLDYAASTLKQTVRGFVDVQDDKVTISVTLPFLLAMMAEKAQALIQKEGTLLLEKK